MRRGLGNVQQGCWAGRDGRAATIAEEHQKECDTNTDDEGGGKDGGGVDARGKKVKVKPAGAGG